jgi:hypothetical protein
LGNSPYCINVYCLFVFFSDYRMWDVSQFCWTFLCHDFNFALLWAYFNEVSCQFDITFCC